MNLILERFVNSNSTLVVTKIFYESMTINTEWFQIKHLCDQFFSLSMYYLGKSLNF